MTIFIHIVIGGGDLVQKDVPENGEDMKNDP